MFMEKLLEQLKSYPSPVQEIESETFASKGLRLLVKRDDLLHSHVPGNKWRKLKYNLLEARRLGYQKLLTFGGAYSNHLAAVAAAGWEFGISTLGVVRGEKCEPLNPTLKFAVQCGMELVFAARANFRQKNHNAILEAIEFDASEFFVLPPGGANCWALKGCAEIMEEVEKQLGGLPDFTCTACGTGATLAGILAGLKGRKKALGIAVLKGDFMECEVKNLLESCGENVPENWQVNSAYHLGGYAKFDARLIDFINDFKRSTGISLDPIYTGKLFFALFDLAEKGFFEAGSTVLAVHTGGLQGIEGFNERHGNLIT